MYIARERGIPGCIVQDFHSRTRVPRHELPGLCSPPVAAGATADPRRSSAVDGPAAGRARGRHAPRRRARPGLVVVGAAADRVRAEADLGDAVLGRQPGLGQTGMGSSLRAGLAALAGTARRRRRRAAGGHAGRHPRRRRPGRRRRRPARPWRWAATAAGAATRSCSAATTGPGSPRSPRRRGARAYLRAHEAVPVVPCGDVADDTDLDCPPAGDTPVGRGTLSDRSRGAQLYPQGGVIADVDRFNRAAGRRGGAELLDLLRVAGVGARRWPPVARTPTGPR